MNTFENKKVKIPESPSKNQNKTRYLIRFDGLFEYGYVRPTIIKKTQDIKMTTHNEVVNFAKKYRFKFMANIMCRLCNWSSKMAYDLRTFKVEEHEF